MAGSRYNPFLITGNRRSYESGYSDGELDLLEKIFEILKKKHPPILGDDDYDFGYDAGYKAAIELLKEELKND